jgi:CBS domain-containing protein
MICPSCRFENFEGEDTCANCGADLRTADVPQPALEYHDTVLGAQLEVLEVGHPLTVGPAAAVSDAIRQMHESGRDCLLVIDGGRLVGIFTDRDAVLKVAGRPADGVAVRDVMTPDPVVLRRDDTLAVAINKMAVGGFRHIPVVDGNEPLGVVAAADVFRHIAASLG